MNTGAFTAVRHNDVVSRQVFFRPGSASALLLLSLLSLLIDKYIKTVVLYKVIDASPKL